MSSRKSRKSKNGKNEYYDNICWCFKKENMKII